MRVGMLHPGEMGAALGAALRSSGREVHWASVGRSVATRQRASDAGLTDAESITALAALSDVLLSVCPPGAAADVATSIAQTGFDGVYVDANAVSPATAATIGTTIVDGGAAFVDGGIVGGPPRRSGSTRLFLSGELARTIAALFEGSVVDTVVLDSSPVAASSLKMSYAAYTKGSSALLIAARGLAEAAGVEAALVEEWARSQPGLADRYDGALAAAAAKGWRWESEMREIAASCADAGLPPGFHEAAAEIFSHFDRPEP